ncbi:MAG: hypothetical protein CMH31_01905 [Micavibrio sp.]|nr:hypothetical protein [Micavibrio sp.]|tara:strand:- start:324 stop:692 length:369 start_codon:yes stop_codon:yes gene_type:complete
MSFGKSSKKIGYTRREFGAIFQIYSQNVYTGLFKDFSFTEVNGRYFISFREEAGKTPLITIEKRKLGPDRSLFVATSPGPRNTLVEISRSEKIEAFIRQIRIKIEAFKKGSTLKGDNVSSIL